MSLTERLRRAWQGFRADYGKAPWDDFWYGSAAGATRAGLDVSETLAANCGALMACVRLMAGTVATLPLRLYERTGTRGKQPARDHPLYRLLHDAPNPRMTAVEFRELAQHHLELRGNFFAQKVTNRRGVTEELWPLHPDRIRMLVEEEQTAGREGRVAAVRYLYRRTNGQEVALDEDAVLHIRGLGSDGILGYSPVTLHRESIGLTMAAEAYGAAHFGNGARLAYVIIRPGVFKDEAAAAEFMRRWNAAHQGPDRANRVAVLEGGGEIKTVGVSPEDSQYLETRRFQLAEMARIVGYIPPHLIGDVERSTSWGAGIEAQNTAFLQYGLLPRLRRWEQRLTESLLSEAEREQYFFEHAVEGLLRADTQARGTFYQVLRRLGAFTANDILALENMNDRGDAGDTYWEPLDVRVVDRDGNLVYQPERKDALSTDSMGPAGRVACEPLVRVTLERVYRRALRDLVSARKHNTIDVWEAEHRAYLDAQLAPLTLALHAAGLVAGHLAPLTRDTVPYRSDDEVLAALVAAGTRQLLGG